ncbi:hypothetical protein CBR_g51066 [Chara braunii]|uniref:Uncharacterized protein n=1 Tax=Chara braunii TaxID=69332 RepID=A0A388K616_CHABU|nr:hypothetical protein CBR_g51066 [Chara braunii]|eukprot:GBG65471.1 hypothetical protein CBR_g51066 [Chara braunii]
MKECIRKKIRKRKADLERKEKEEEEKKRSEEENRREQDRLKEAEAREARMEARLVRLLAQHTKTVDRGESLVGKKKSPKTKARMLREIRSYLVESDDDSEEVREEAGKLIEAIEKRKGKRREVVGGVVSRNQRQGLRNDPVKIEEDDEVRTPAVGRGGVGPDVANNDMLDFAIEMHRHLSGKKVPELRKLCNREGIEWSKRDVAIGELVRCKAKLAYGDFVENGRISSIFERKNVLRDLMKRPGNIRKIYKLGSEEIVNLYRTAGLFSEKKTRNHLRYMISNVARRKYGVEVRRRPCMKIPFSTTIRLGEVRRIATAALTQVLPDKYIRSFIGRRVRVVLKKRITVGGVLHNHWSFAEKSVGICVCQDLDLPRIEGHVQVRIEHIPGVPTFVVNSKNITKGVGLSGMMVAECIKEGLRPWSKGKVLHLDQDEIGRCVEARRADCGKAMSASEVREATAAYQNLVAVPIDRNPGATLLLCPHLYIKACRETFNLSASYVEDRRVESEILAEMKEEYEEKGLRRIARWQSAGKVGQAYVLPKDKDLQRWRPISPCTNDPARLAGSRVGKAIRYMLFCLDRRSHFDLKSMDELRDVCERMEGRLGKIADAAFARSFDVKDMFARLSH